MQYENSNVVGLKLDMITRGTRAAFVLFPKAVTRVALGVTLALDDVANDEASELLSVKLADGVHNVLTTAGFVGKASACSIASVASSATGAVGSVMAKVSSPEAKAARTARAERIPGVQGVKALMRQSGAEIRHFWDATATVYVAVPSEDVREQSALVADEFSMFTSDIQSMDLAMTPDLVPTI